jgi:hypothetical protein
MATNIVLLNVYQFNNTVYDPGSPKLFGFPTTGNILLNSCLNSPTRSLSSGVNVYTMIQIQSTGAANSNGNQYYVAETVQQIQTLFNS